MCFVCLLCRLIQYSHFPSVNPNNVFLNGLINTVYRNEWRKSMGIGSDIIWLSLLTSPQGLGVTLLWHKSAQACGTIPDPIIHTASALMPPEQSGKHWPFLTRANLVCPLNSMVAENRESGPVWFLFQPMIVFKQVSSFVVWIFFLNRREQN